MARIRAKDPKGLAYWEGLADRFSETGWYHSIELPDGRVVEGLQTLEQQQARLREFPIPDDLSGKRVLDIGAWDGWFAFEMERRGAEVMAIDNIEQPAFHLAHDRLGSKVDYRVMDVLELSPDKVGRFDIVLFFGVLYHLKHPLLGLEKVCAVTKEMALVESFVTDEGPGGRPVLEFYETDELCGRQDNWVGPTTECLLAFCRTAGFARVEPGRVLEQRAHVVCRRDWGPAPAAPRVSAPEIREAVHVLTHERSFSTARDDYLTVWFDSEEADLDASRVFPEVGGYGIRPIWVGHDSGSKWQVNFKLPPGLDAGRYPVRLRTTDSPFSEPAEIFVDQKEPVPKPERLEIAGLTDAKTYESQRIAFSGEMWISLWVRGLPEGVRREHVRLRLGSAPLAVDFLSDPDQRGLRQLNARLPESTIPGDYPVSVTCAGVQSPPLPLEVLPPQPD
jgi:tRNA (mo5U34)-methyltransferase